MDFKYYDLLTCIIIGVFVMFVSTMIMDISFDANHTIIYLPLAYIIGYIANAVSFIVEGFWYWTIGGKPSDNLLTFDSSKKYSGIKKVKFYHTKEAIEYLKKDLNNENATPSEMFSEAKINVCGGEKTRIQDFNTQYAFSRVLLTTFTISAIAFVIAKPYLWYGYTSIIPIFILWNRYKEKGYYYAREVLYAYLNKKKTNAK